MNARTRFTRVAKEGFELENYLNVITDNNLRTHMTREIEHGRFNNINRESRICKLCNQNEFESEFHIHFVSTNYNSLRSKY